jgi:anaerobic ribonucleoside-triphosphate reductase activating protein
MIWNLNKIQYPVYNLGPGKRLGIWVQGCSIQCNGCITKSLWDKGKSKSVQVLAVFEMINHLCQDYYGITITGGEPFDQYPQLMALSTMLKRKTKLNILCYSGYYLTEIETKFPDKAFYQCVDYLIDGRYDKNLASEDSLKGSENQSIYSFSKGKALKTGIDNSIKLWSLKCEKEMVYMAGIPGNNEMETLFQSLSSLGIGANLV